MIDIPIIADLKSRIQKAMISLSEDLATIRTGRATPALVENLVISAYAGTASLKVKELSTITTEGARIIVIAPFDPAVVRDIEKGINSANLGFSAAVDGNLIRINIPPLTAERREEFIKIAHIKIEAGRVIVRQIRHDEMSKLKRQFEAKEIAEDEKKHLERAIQEETNEIMAEIDVLRGKKEEELKQI